MIRPLGDRVVIEPQEKEEKTPGGIVLPEKAKEKPMEGKVVAVGEGRRKGEKRIPPEVRKGDHVIYSKYAGTEIEVDGKTYLIVNESDLLAVVETAQDREKELVEHA